MPAKIRDTDVKLMMNNESFKSPVASCKNPVFSGPNDVPMDVIIMVKEKATASSRGRIPRRLKGTVISIGKKAQATPFIRDRRNNPGLGPEP